MLVGQVYSLCLSVRLTPCACRSGVLRWSAGNSWTPPPTATRTQVGHWVYSDTGGCTWIQVGWTRTQVGGLGHRWVDLDIGGWTRTQVGVLGHRWGYRFVYFLFVFNSDQTLHYQDKPQLT